jgi:hypothetical protein
MAGLIPKGLQNKYANYIFQGKRKDEEIILLLRRYWLVLFFRFFPLFIYLIALILFNLFSSDMLAVSGIEVNENILSLAGSFLFMFFWLILFIVWIDYYLDVWIVTNKRIINIEQLGLFRREISELDHVKIQDVTSEVKGLIPTLFNYGYIYVQTAGEKERFVFKQVPDPVRVRNIIMELQQWSILQEKRKEGEILRGKL